MRVKLGLDTSERFGLLLCCSCCSHLTLAKLASSAVEMSGADFSLTTFSPSGKLVQIEYALNAVNAGKTSLFTHSAVPVCFEKRTLESKSICYFSNRSAHQFEKPIC